MVSGLFDPRVDVSVNIISPINRLHPINRDLVAWWPCLPGTTGGRRVMDIMDAGPNGNHAIIENMTPIECWKSHNRSNGWGVMNFSNGDTDKVTIPNSNSLDFENWTGFTITFYAMTNILASVKGDELTAISNFDGAGNRPFSLEIKTNDVWGAGVGGGSVSASATIPVVVGVPQHVMYTWFAGVSLTTYIDGVKDGFDSTVGASIDAATGLTAFGLRNRPTEDQPFDGLIWDVRLLKRGVFDIEAPWHYYLSRQRYPGVLNRIHRPIIDVAAVGGIDIRNHIIPAYMRIN